MRGGFCTGTVLSGGAKAFEFKDWAIEQGGSTSWRPDGSIDYAPAPAAVELGSFRGVLALFDKVAERELPRG